MAHKIDLVVQSVNQYPETGGATVDDATADGGKRPRRLAAVVVKPRVADAEGVFSSYDINGGAPMTSPGMSQATLSLVFVEAEQPFPINPGDVLTLSVKQATTKAGAVKSS